MENKYILFGAGYYATVAISLLGKENIEFIVDNNPDKAGMSVEGIQVFAFAEKKAECTGRTIVISVSEKYSWQIERQLEDEGINNFVTMAKFRQNRQGKR